ncbi:MAG TPA: GNAT family N-acetyltransferase [Gaiellaceae bacterium]|nr:GNAT family N-acetyltransferase [Gaiellaceae bacterium]
MKFSAREAFDGADLRRMQDLVVETRHLRGLQARHHPGDLAWARHARGTEGEQRIRIWELDDLVVAWGRLEDDRLDLHVHPEVRGELVPEVVAWAEGETPADTLTVEVFDGDASTLMPLAAAGYAPTAQPGLVALQQPLSLPPPPPRLPDGFRARHLEPGAGDRARRVAVHRAAFSVHAPSRVTEESYARVQAAWPYRHELDWVVEAPDGSFVSACTAWIDEGSRVVLLEPVGTDPAHWRRGFGRAVCLAALRASQVEGARSAIVCSPDPALYEAVGFRPYGRFIWLERSLR